MAFTTLMLFQLFNVFNARSDERSAFDGLFPNHWLWRRIALSLVLHAAVIYVPFLQQAFSTTSLSAGDWLTLRGRRQFRAVAGRDCQGRRTANGVAVQVASLNVLRNPASDIPNSPAPMAASARNCGTRRSPRRRGCGS